MRTLQRLAYRLGYRIAEGWWRIRRSRGTAVRILVQHNHRILLVRHTYGNRHLWNLPGGGVKRGEQLATAARRELIEETGILPGRLRRVASIEVEEDSRRCQITAYQVTVTSRDIDADPGEIAAARWFPLARLPRELRPSARSLIALRK